jgi:DNA-binding Lrp family transcriptional regulator
MKETEYKLLSELAKNSRRSDRELARAVGVSQPTITRMIQKLGQQGIIKEYTIIPDFDKLGYEILAFTFLKYEKQISQQEYEKIKEKALELEKKSGSSTIMVLNGAGLGSDRIIVSYHEDYTTFLNYVKYMRQLSGFHISYVDSFVVSLSDKTNARPLTLSVLAEHIPHLKKNVKASIEQFSLQSEEVNHSNQSEET